MFIASNVIIVFLQSIGNSSILKTSHLGDSPFYPGKTMYGGAAAAVRQPKVRNTPYQVGLSRIGNSPVFKLIG